MSASYGIPADNILVIPNGIPIEKFGRVKTDIKDRCGCNTLLFAIGRLAKQKGSEYLLRSIPLVEERDFKLVIAGEGPEENKLLKLIKELGIEERVSLLGGVSGLEKRELYSAADIFLCPSLWESFGMTILEAMACRVPIIASRAASIPETVGDAGILVEPRNPKQLASAVESLIGDRKSRLKLGNAGYRRAIENFGSEKMARQYIELYGKLTE